MIKSHYRDYAAAAFQLHAAWEANKASLLDGLTREAREAAAADLRAVGEAKQSLARMREGVYILKAVALVYEAGHKLAPGEISRRVDRASLELPAGRATIFRYLAIACEAFARARGLRV